MVKYKLVWTNRSQQHMRALFKYISEESPQNAIKVINDIIAAAEKTITNPEYYHPDKFKQNNDGSYRAFEKHRYRIAYRYQKNIIRILRVRHTKMEPKNFELFLQVTIFTIYNRKWCLPEPTAPRANGAYK